MICASSSHMHDWTLMLLVWIIVWFWYYKSSRNQRLWSASRCQQVDDKKQRKVSSVCSVPHTSWYLRGFFQQDVLCNHSDQGLSSLAEPAELISHWQLLCHHGARRQTSIHGKGGDYKCQIQLFGQKMWNCTRHIWTAWRWFLMTTGHILQWKKKNTFKDANLGSEIHNAVKNSVVSM